MTTDFEAERDQLWQTIDSLMAARQLAPLQQARQLLGDWLRQHPDDYYSQDGGEELAMMEEALTLLEAEKVSEPVAV